MAAARPNNDDRDKRLTLAFLWAWALFNYVYGDILKIFTIFKSPGLQLQLEAGSLGGIPLDNSTMLAMAAAMELPIAMIFLSWKLSYRPNRILNIVLGIVFTLIMGSILFAPGRLPPLSGYTLYGAIEMATTLSIAWIAWKWRAPDASPQR